MKPNFALNLTFDGIALLHRVPSGWHLVGEVALEAPDLGGALAALRESALAIDPTGLRCKLVIPNEQIRFLTRSITTQVDEAAVRAALDGTTPYDVSELVYDWTFEGGTLHIAAVARETLEEAESFALDHGFNPVSFVATPDQALFPGEPFFGLTAAAPGIVGPGVPVARDLQPIRVIGVARVPAAASGPEAMTGPASDPAAASAPNTASDAAPGKLDTPDAAPTVAVASEPLSRPDAGLPADDVAAPPPSGRVSVGKAAPAPLFDTPPDQDDALAAQLRQAPSFSSIRAKASDATADSDAETAPVALPGAGPRQAADSLRPRSPAPLTQAMKASLAQTKTAPVARSNTQSDAQSMPTSASVPSAPPGKTAALATKTAPARTSATPSVNALTGAAITAPAAPGLSGPFAATPPRTGTFATLGRALRRAPGDRASPPAKPAPPVAPPVAPPAAALSAQLAAPVATPLGTPGLSLTASAAPSPPRARPRSLGLILTLALLLFLAAVAAWAAIFGETTVAWLRGADAPPRGVAQTGLTIDTALITPEELADAELELDGLAGSDLAGPDLAGSDGPDLGTTQAEAATMTAALDLASFETDAVQAMPGLSLPQLRVLPGPSSPEDARARYAATGIWDIAPDAPTAAAPIDLDQVYIASIDPRVSMDDAVALPGVAVLRPDAAPPALASPAAAGTRFDLDARGLVAATAEGALTPDGVRVFAGRPPVAIPAALLARTLTAEVVLDPQIARLAAFRPRLRPENLADAAERALLGGLTRSELASIRPRARPDTITIRAAAAAAANAAAASASTAAVLTAPPAIKPRIRPEDLGVAATTPRATPPAGGVSREEFEDDEGDVEVAAARGKTVVPKVPSQANVAKAATDKNVLNLREVNLIGVYGTQSSRRALVRLSNGRYQKVQVGDRVDGGRVVAISDSELRYTKGGRNVTLKMPRS